MKKTSIGIILISILAFSVALIGFGQLEYRGTPVTDASKETNQELLEVAKSSQSEEIHLIDGLEITNAAYEMVKSRRNNSDQEAEAYFKRIAAKSRVIERESKKLNIQVTDEEVKEYMNQTFSIISETDKEVLAIASGFKNFEEYKNAKSTYNSAKHFIMESKYVNQKLNDLKISKSSTSDETVTEEALKEQINSELETLINEELSK